MSNFGLPHHGWPGGTAPLAGAAKPPSRLTMASRSIARFIAWRTLTFEVGCSGTNENCHGQVCG